MTMIKCRIPMKDNHADHPLGLALRQLALATTVAAALGLSTTQAAISVGATGSGVQAFPSLPANTAWSTMTWTGGVADITDATTLDAAVQTLAASSITSTLGSSTTNPPSANAIARFNGTLFALQMRPTNTVKGCVLMATLANATGGGIDNLEISYDFGGPAAGTESVAGLRAYYSLTGLTGSWTSIPAFCTATTGHLQTVVPLSSTWANAATMYVLWVDDTTALTGNNALFTTLDNVSFAKAGTAAAISAFNFGLPAYGAATIVGTAISLNVPAGTDVTALTPSFTLSNGATCDKVSGGPTTYDFSTTPQTYTVTSAVGTPVAYTVTVNFNTVVDISNTLTPWEPANTGAGVRPNVVVGTTGNFGRLVGLTQTHWGSGGFTTPLILNGNTLILDSGGGNTANYAGPISGAGAVTIQNNGQTIGGSLGNTYTGTTSVKTVVTLNKSSGNALCGTITGTGAVITWSASDQIDDTSDVTLNSTSHLILGAHTETISKLYLVTGAYVDTAAGGILKVSELYLNGVQQAHVGKGSGDGFVLGTGYIDVANSGPPVIATVPDKPTIPVPTNGTTGLHPMFVTLLDWADAAGATSYDVYLWDASGAKPGTPTATVPLSQYAPTLPLNSNATYNWQVVAQNAVGPTNGDVWTFTTTDATYVSNVLTPWEPANTGAGVRIDTFIPSGGAALLVGLTQTHWGSGGFSRAVDLNGNTLILDSGGGNGANYAGPISGAGTVTIQNNGQTIGGSLGNTYTGTTNVRTVVTLNKSSGNALCGTITGTGAVITWAANDQINDASSVTLASGSSLALAGHTETIASLTLATGTSVNTGSGGVLTVANLTVGGSLMPSDTYTSSNSSFVTGTGSVVVPAVGTPYEIWAVTNAGGQTPGEDSNHDGVQNGVAFFMGMNGLTTNPGVVNGKVTWPNGGNIPSSAYGTKFVVQTSTDLVNWADVLVGDLNLNNTSGSVAYTLPTGEVKQFCRLSVTP